MTQEIFILISVLLICQYMSNKVQVQVGGNLSDAIANPSFNEHGLLKYIYQSNALGQQLDIIKRGVHRGPLNYNWGKGYVMNSGLKDNVLLDFRGYIRVPETGTYEFKIQCDDGIMLSVNGKKLIEEWGNKDKTVRMIEKISTGVPLNKNNNYRFNLRWFENGGHALLKLFWRHNGSNWQIVPANVFYQKPQIIKDSKSRSLSNKVKKFLQNKPKNKSGLKLASYHSNKKGRQLKLINKSIHIDNIDYNWRNNIVLNTGLRDRVSLVFSGYIKAPQNGIYTFRTQSDDGVHLKIDGKTLVKQWKLQSPKFGTSEPINMTKGEYYPINLRWFENGGGALLKLFWKYNNQDWEIIPNNVFFQEPEESLDIQEKIVAKQEYDTEKEDEKVKKHIEQANNIYNKLKALGKLRNMDKDIVNKINKKIVKAGKRINKKLKNIKKQQGRIETKITTLKEGQEKLSSMQTLERVQGNVTTANKFHDSRGQMAYAQGMLTGHEQRLNGIETKLFVMKGSLAEIKTILNTINTNLQQGYKCQIKDIC